MVSGSTWASAGLAELTGRPDGPPLDAPAMVDDRLCRALDHVTRALRIVGVGFEGHEPGALLASRARHGGLTRQGNLSCGGGTRLLSAADGVIALNRSRAADDDLLPAWLDGPGPADPGADEWRWIADAARHHPVADLLERGALLGLAVSSVGETTVPADVEEVVRWASPRKLWSESATLRPIRSTTFENVRVVDLSALWAGPLCCQLLRRVGASVHVVESLTRSDPTSRTYPGFHAELRAGTTREVLDVTAPQGRGRLQDLVRSADIVVSSVRPRALRGLGCEPTEIAGDAGPLWLSITAHGWPEHPDDPVRVGFGDDAAVAGGLVARDAQGVVFAGDAIADPLTGMLGAAAVIDAWTSGRRGLLDAALARSAAFVAGGSTDKWVPLR